MQLQEVEEALDESLSEVWDAIVDPIALAIEPYEQTHILELVNTDNKVFNKIITVFGALCSEIKHLSETVLIH